MIRAESVTEFGPVLVLGSTDMGKQEAKGILLDLPPQDWIKVNIDAAALANGSSEIELGAVFQKQQGVMAEVTVKKIK